MKCAVCQVKLDGKPQVCHNCGFPALNEEDKKVSSIQIEFARRQWQLAQSSNKSQFAIKSNKGQQAFESLMAHYIKPLSFDFLKNVFKKIPSVEQLKDKMPRFELIKGYTSFGNPYIEMLRTMPILHIKQFLVKDNLGFKFDNIKSFKQTDVNELLESQTAFLKEALADKREEIKLEALKKYQKLEEHRLKRNKNGINKP